MSARLLVILARVVAVIVAAVAVVLLLGPFGAPDGWDKVLHAAGFYGFTLLALACFPWHRKGDLIVTVLALGASSELAQGITGRDMSVFDFCADAAGVALAAGPIYVARFRQIAQRQPNLAGAPAQPIERRQRVRRPHEGEAVGLARVQPTRRRRSGKTSTNIRVT